MKELEMMGFSSALALRDFHSLCAGCSWSCRDESGGLLNVRFPPNSDQTADIAPRLLCAMNGLMHRSKSRHSITSSARASSDGGTSRPSALAVLRFTVISNFVGNCTGRSPGFSPRRMRSTYEAARRTRSTGSTP
jgi:hypothetical protein